MFVHKRNICGTKINVRIQKIILRALKYIICKSQMFSGAIEKVFGNFFNCPRRHLWLTKKYFRIISVCEHLFQSCTYFFWCVDIFWSPSNFFLVQKHLLYSQKHLLYCHKHLLLRGNISYCHENIISCAEIYVFQARISCHLPFLECRCAVFK